MTTGLHSLDHSILNQNGAGWKYLGEYCRSARVIWFRSADSGIKLYFSNLIIIEAENGIYPKQLP